MPELNVLYYSFCTSYEVTNKTLYIYITKPILLQTCVISVFVILL